MSQSYNFFPKGKYAKDRRNEESRRRNPDYYKDSPTYSNNPRLKENISQLERDLLQQKVKLSDGTSVNVISCFKTENTWRYICHVCNIRGLLWNALLDHIDGQRHKEKVRNSNHSQSRYPIKKKINVKDNGRKGDNESESASKNKSKCKIQKELDDCKRPLIGLEYLLEIESDRSNHVYYYCLLCDKEGSVSFIKDHLSHNDHMTKYLQKFFFTAAQKLETRNKIASGRENHLFYLLTEHVVARIEHCLGRMKPLQIKRNEFENQLKMIFSKINNGCHLQETLGNSFADCVNIDHLNPNNCVVGWNGKFWSSSENKNDSRLENMFHQPHDLTFDDKFEYEERRFYDYTRSRHDDNLWQKYQEKVKLIEENLTSELNYFRGSPEKHPKYDKEWKEYCQKRNEELLSINEDPRNYDIRVEFNAFWDIRLNKLFKEIFEKEKAHLRNQLQSLQTDFNTRSGDKSMVHEKFEFSKKYLNSNDGIKNFNIAESMQKSHQDSHETTKRSSQVIPVLRQLSVLEFSLGSLGPRVVDLLGTALTLEKSSKNGSDAIMLSNENYVLLETVAEKLKGLLQSGLLQETIVPVTEAAINSLTKLFDSFDSGSKSRDSPSDSRSHIKELVWNEPEGSSYRHEIKSRSVDQRLSSHEKWSRSHENRTHINEKGFSSIDRKPHSFEQLTSTERAFPSSNRKPSSKERIFHSVDRRPRSSEREPQLNDRRPNFNDRKPQSNEKRLNSRWKRSGSIDRKQNQSNKRPRNDDRQLRFHDKSFNEQSNRVEQNLKTNISRSAIENPYSSKSNQVVNELLFCSNKDKNTENAFVTNNISLGQNILPSRNIMVSEIDMFVDNLSTLSYLPYLKKAAISKQITSFLLLRGLSQITEYELLLLIKILVPNVFQTGDLTYSISNAGMSTIPSLLDTSLVTNLTASPSYGQGILKSGGTSNTSRFNKHPVDLVTYPLNNRARRDR